MPWLILLCAVCILGAAGAMSVVQHFGALAHYSLGTESNAAIIADFEANFRANAYLVASESDAHALGGQGLSPEVTP